MRFIGTPAIGTNATFNAPDAGTWFVLDGTHLVSVFTISGKWGIELDHFGTYHNHVAGGSGWAPRAYPYAIIITGSQDISLHDIFLMNPTGGVLIQGPAACGRINIERVVGQPLSAGIECDVVMDVCRFKDNHWWPYWTLDPNVALFVQTSADAYILHRVDNPLFYGCFSYGYRGGVVVAVSASGSTSKASFVNCGFDHGGYMLLIGDAGTIGHSLNFNACYYQGYAGNGGQAIVISGSSANNRITLTGTDLGYTDHQAVAITSTGALNQVFISGGSIVQWDLANDGSTCFSTPSAGNTSRIVVSPETWLWSANDPPPIYTGTAINSPAFKTIGVVKVLAGTAIQSATHNLGYIPTAFTCTPMDDMTPAARFWVSGDGTYVYIHLNATVASDTSFYLMVGIQY